MKRIATIVLFSALAFLAAVSCRKSSEQEIEWRTELQAVKSNLVFMPGGGTETLEVNLSNVSVTSDKSWASASVSGTIISVTVPANEGKLSRYAKLTIKSGSESINAAVIQYGEVFDGMELADMEVPKEGGEFAYPFTSNLAVDVKADQPWVHISFDEDNPIVYVTVDKNEGFGTRFATVSYTAGSNSGSAQVIQEPTYGQVSGWKVEDTDGRYVFPDQIDVITVTPPADMAGVWYVFDVIDPIEFPTGDVDDVMRAVINEISAQIRQLLAAGEIQSMSEVAVKGSASDEFTNLPGTSKAVVMCFDDEGYPTGQYVVTDVTIPDRGPKKTVVDGWEIAHAGATYAHPDQTDRFTITPKAGFENVKYIATVVNKEDVLSIEDYTFTTFAMETREAILAKVASGELSDFDAGLSTGVTTVEGVNVAPDAYVVVVAFGDNQFYTGDYQVSEFTLPDATPAFYKWIGKWNVSRKNDKYDDIDTWEITVKEDGKTLQIVGIESFSDPARHYAEATVDEDGRLVLKTHYTGSYEDSSRGHVDVLLSGQYDDTKAGKTYYTSSLNVVLFRGTLSEDGKTANLEPGLINGYYFKNIQFYGRYKNSSGGTSAVTWNAGPTQIPQTITRVAE